MGPLKPDLTDLDASIRRLIDRVEQIPDAMESRMKAVEQRQTVVEQAQKECDEQTRRHGTELAGLKVQVTGHEKIIDRLQKAPRESRAERQRREGPADEQTGPPIALPARGFLGWFSSLNSAAQVALVGAGLTVAGGVGKGVVDLLGWLWDIIQRAAQSGGSP